MQRQEDNPHQDSAQPELLRPLRSGPGDQPRFSGGYNTRVASDAAPNDSQVVVAQLQESRQWGQQDQAQQAQPGHCWQQAQEQQAQVILLPSGSSQELESVAKVGTPLATPRCDSIPCTKEPVYQTHAL